MSEKKIDLRIEKTYRSLHQAFTALLEEKKFEEFTVNELCERAMIRRTTFYKHFADKYEYFTFFIREISDSFLEQLPPETNPNDLTAYYSYMSEQLLQFTSKNENLVHHIIESNMFPVLLDLLTGYIRTELVQKLRASETFAAADEKTVKVMAAFYAGGLTNAFLLQFRGELDISKEKLLSIIAGIFKNI